MVLFSKIFFESISIGMCCFATGFQLFSKSAIFESLTVQNLYDNLSSNGIFLQDQHLLRMSNEMNRMAFYEAECKKKDELIGVLKEELALYQKHLRDKDYKLVTINRFLPL